MLGFFVTLIKLFNLNLDYKKKAGLKDEAGEKTVIEKDPVSMSDSILSHHRIWTDYNENQYEADIKIRYSELSRSNRLRTQLGLKVNSNDDYIRLVNIISTFDQDKIGILLYHTG